MTNIVKAKLTTKGTSIENYATKLNAMWMYTTGISYTVSGLDKVSVHSMNGEQLSYETQLEWIQKFTNYFGLQVEKNIYE